LLGRLLADTPQFLPLAGMRERVNDSYLCVCLTALWAFGKPRAQEYEHKQDKQVQESEKERDLS
jgi:hypothetical protein